ncbi:hypothetical protein CFP56_042991 [Quercus suber]|uniref:DUF7722 domain-containing protein n=1 Tax=Quercus suber TaxID=58331 RepID=A0AAW0IST2_QUESU
MPEWKLDCLLRDYGLPIIGDVDHERIVKDSPFTIKLKYPFEYAERHKVSRTILEKNIATGNKYQRFRAHM